MKRKAKCELGKLEAEELDENVGNNSKEAKREHCLLSPFVRYLQSVWAGYGSLRLADDSLHILGPTLPPATSGLTLRGIAYVLRSNFVQTE
jgi:hypothetical protein